MKAVLHLQVKRRKEGEGVPSGLYIGGGEQGGGGCRACFCVNKHGLGMLNGQVRH